MSFVNTRTSLGEQAAFDALIAHTLTELNEDGIAILPNRCISYQDSMVSVNFPNVIQINSQAFYDNPLLETIDIGKQCTITGGFIYNCPKLTALILRGTTGISTLTNTGFLTDCPIITLKCGIYVPRALLSDYLANERWAEYAKSIKAIEDMPVTDFSTITHTWTQIKAMIQDESFFNSAYAIGDVKKLVYGEHSVYAEIVKIDSTNKYVDFVIDHFDEKVRFGDNANTVKYSTSLIKARLDTIYANELPSDLKAVISAISKQYYCCDGTTETVNAPLWLLNTKDVNFTGTNLKESEGESYTVFTTNGARTKYSQDTSLRENWWLGSAFNDRTFTLVMSYGDATNNSPTGSYGLIFGFRIQKTT